MVDLDTILGKLRESTEPPEVKKIEKPVVAKPTIRLELTAEVGPSIYTNKEVMAFIGINAIHAIWDYNFTCTIARGFSEVAGFRHPIRLVLEGNWELSWDYLRNIVTEISNYGKVNASARENPNGKWTLLAM